LVVYVLGNPLIGQSMLQCDLRGAHNIPPRLLVLEKADGQARTLYIICDSSRR
ncbi:hypothetical protein DFH09DRAFT_902399, partial [Mycena vulgaris]